MLYTLVLSIFLVVSPEYPAFITSVQFKTEKECKMALEKAHLSVHPELQQFMLGVKGECKQTPQT